MDKWVIKKILYDWPYFFGRIKKGPYAVCSFHIKLSTLSTTAIETELHCGQTEMTMAPRVLEENDNYYEEVIVEDSDDEYIEEEIIEDGGGLNSVDMESVKSFLLSLAGKDPSDVEYHSEEEWEEYVLPDVITPIQRSLRLSLYPPPSLDTIADNSERSTSMTTSRRSSSIRSKIRKEIMDKGNSSINLAGIQEEKEGSGQTTQPISEYEEPVRTMMAKGNESDRSAPMQKKDMVNGGNEERMNSALMPSLKTVEPSGIMSYTDIQTLLKLCKASDALKRTKKVNASNEKLVDSAVMHPLKKANESNRSAPMQKKDMVNGGNEERMNSALMPSLKTAEPSGIMSYTDIQTLLKLCKASDALKRTKKVNASNQKLVDSAVMHPLKKAVNESNRSAPMQKKDMVNGGNEERMNSALTPSLKTVEPSGMMSDTDIQTLLKLCKASDALKRTKKVNASNEKLVDSAVMHSLKKAVNESNRSALMQKKDMVNGGNEERMNSALTPSLKTVEPSGMMSNTDIQMLLKLCKASDALKRTELNASNEKLVDSAVMHSLKKAVQTDTSSVGQSGKNLPCDTVAIVESYLSPQKTARKSYPPAAPKSILMADMASPSSPRHSRSSRFLGATKMLRRKSNSDSTNSVSSAQSHQQREISEPSRTTRSKVRRRRRSRSRSKSIKEKTSRRTSTSSRSTSMRRCSSVGQLELQDSGKSHGKRRSGGKKSLAMLFDRREIRIREDGDSTTSSILKKIKQSSRDTPSIASTSISNNSKSFSSFKTHRSKSRERPKSKSSSSKKSGSPERHGDRPQKTRSPGQLGRSSSRRSLSRDERRRPRSASMDQKQRVRRNRLRERPSALEIEERLGQSCSSLASLAQIFYQEG
jgi:hypothetical protein